MRTSIARPALAAICLITSLVAAPVKAQTREQGPWWPHPIWGKDDRAGGSNWITPQKIVAALHPALWRGHHLDGGTRDARGTTR